MTNDHENHPEPLACCVFSLKPVTCEFLLRFERETARLVEEHPVRRFYIVAEYCNTGYMQILEQLAGSAGIEIIGVTNYTNMSPEWPERMVKDFVPPFHRLENIDTGTRVVRAKALRRIKAMLDRSDFCICDLTHHPLAKNIKSHLQKLGHVTVLDFGEPLLEGDPLLALY